MSKQSFSIDYGEDDNKGEIAVSVDSNGQSYYDTYKFDPTQSKEELIDGLNEGVDGLAKKFEEPKKTETPEEIIKRLQEENAALRKQVAAKPTNVKQTPTKQNKVNDGPFGTKFTAEDYRDTIDWLESLHRYL